jgi:excisionase family DNA binding protein
MSDPDELLDIQQAAQFLNVSETSLRRWTNAGLLPCLRIGGRRERRFRRADLLGFMQKQSAGGEAASGRPAGSSSRDTLVSGVSVSLGTHLCGLYTSDAGRATQASAFLADGLRPRSVCYLVALPDARNAVLASLEEGRPSLRRDLDAGRLVLSEYAESAGAQWDYWESRMDAATRQGAESLRVVGDLRGLGQRVSREELIEYEAGYEERVARRFPVVTLCQYDVRWFSNLDVLNALKGHRDTFRYPAERLLA